MGPYRTAAPPDPPRRAHDGGDDRTIYVMLLVVGLIRVVIAVADGEDFHAEATIAGLLLAAGVIGLLRDWLAG